MVIDSISSNVRLNRKRSLKVLIRCLRREQSVIVKAEAVRCAFFVSNLRYIAQGLRGLDVRHRRFRDGLVRHRVCPAARRVRKGGGKSGREGMPSFSAVRIDSSSRVLCVVVFDAGTFKLG